MFVFLVLCPRDEGGMGGWAGSLKNCDFFGRVRKHYGDFLPWVCQNYTEKSISKFSLGPPFFCFFLFFSPLSLPLWFRLDCGSALCWLVFGVVGFFYLVWLCWWDLRENSCFAAQKVNMWGSILGRVPGFGLFSISAYFLKILGRNDDSLERPRRVISGSRGPGGPGWGPFFPIFPYFSFNLGIFFQIKNKKGSREGLFSLFLKFLGRSVG